MAHILVVNDQAYVTELISEELAEEGHRVTGVGDMESAWRELEESPVDLVLLDLYLGELKGWDALRDIGKRHANLPVLILTAYNNFAQDPRLRQADGYVTKSFGAFEELKKKIAEVLHSKKVFSPIRYLIRIDRYIGLITAQKRGRILQNQIPLGRVDTKKGGDDDGATL